MSLGRIITNILEYISVGGVTIIASTILWKAVYNCGSSDSLFAIFMLLAFCFWITIPAVILCLISFFSTICKRAKRNKVLLALHLLNLVLFVAIGISHQRLVCDPFIMEKHYESHKQEMHDLIKYTRQAIADSCSVRLELSCGGGIEYLDRLTTGAGGALPDTASWSTFPDTAFSVTQYISLEQTQQELGVSKEESKSICKKLAAAGCFAIETDNYGSLRCSTISFRTIGLGKYKFKLYDEPLSDEAMKRYQDECTMIVYNRHVLFEYGGGAIGTYCMPGKAAYLKSKQDKS